MVMLLDTKALLQQQRNRCLSALRALGPEASKLVNELESLDMALSNMATGAAAQYAGFRLAIDAITAALTVNDRAMTPEELSTEITSGGWLSQDGRAPFNVKDSVDYHTRRQGAKKKIIRMLNGMVGMYEWPDEKFQVPQADNMSA